MSSTDIVKLKFKKDADKKMLAFWPASNIPIEPKILIEKSEDNSNSNPRLLVEGFVPFVSDDSGNEDVNYFIGSKSKNGRLVCRPVQLHRMMPVYSNVEQCKQNDTKVSLTEREKLDELKEKFGSKKTQRQLANKRKYEIQFGEEDVDNLPAFEQSQIEGEKEDGNATANADNVQADQPLSSILPKRNAEAKTIEEVYSLFDIITTDEREAIDEHELELSVAIQTECVLNMFKNGADHENKKLMAIYADLLLRMLKLKATAMRQNNPMPEVVGKITEHLFNRYTSTKQFANQTSRYVITDQNKDRIFIYVTLLLFMLNNYKSLQFEMLQEVFKIKQPYLRRLLEVIGCYIENVRNAVGSTDKVAVLKLPLNAYKEPKAKRARR